MTAAARWEDPTRRDGRLREPPLASRANSFTRAALAPDQEIRLTDAQLQRAYDPVPFSMPASSAISGSNVTPSPLSTICTSVCGGCQHLCFRAQLRPVACGQHGLSGNGRPRASAAAFVNEIRRMRGGGTGPRHRERRRRACRRTGRADRLAASERQGERMQSSWPRWADHRRAGWFPRADRASAPASLAQARQDAWQQEGAIVGITPRRSSPAAVCRRRGRDRRALRLAQHAPPLGGDALAKGVKRTTRRVRSTRVTPISDPAHAGRRERRLGDEAGIGGAAEMTMVMERGEYWSCFSVGDERTSFSSITDGLIIDWII